MKALISGTSLRASTQALTKKDMNPSETPWRFWKASLYRERISMARAMSISLKVVSMAVLCLDASSRSAMRLRMGVMGLRTSVSVGAAG